jgi:Family of unknown function (DUF6580)
MNQGKNVRPLAVSLTVLGALARLAPHPYNFAPVGGMSLYAGARLRGWQAFLLPLVLMAVTDPLVGGYSFITPVVYASFLVNVWIGRRLQRSESFLGIGAACLLCSVQFFVVTNFAIWAAGMYPHTFAGLTVCYAQAIPFFGRTLAGDLLYSGALFGLHAWLSRIVSTPERVASAA